MGKTINDILFSDMRHNSRVFRLHTKMNDSLMRYNEIIKGKQIGRIDNVKIPLEKKGYYGLNKGRDAGQDARNDERIEKRYYEYMDYLKKKRMLLIDKELLKD